jgi:predicted PurR-regulated permease PerM
MTRPWKIAFLSLLAVVLLVLIYFLRAVFLPFLVALIAAYILNPILNALEARKVPRLASIAGLYLLFAGVLAAVAFWAIPATVGEATSFAQEMAAPDSKARQLADRAMAHVEKYLGAENPRQVWEILRSKLAGQEKEIATGAAGVLAGVISFASQALGGVFGVFSFVALIPVYLFFLLKNMNDWWERVTRVIPRAYRTTVLGTLGRVHAANAAYFRGQLTISAIEGTIVCVCLLIFGVRFAVPLGLLYFVLSMFPFVGPFLGFIIVQLVTVIGAGGFGSQFWMVAAMFLAIQALEGLLLQPMILGKETGLHPVAIIFSLLVCGQLFGFFGMLVAVPLTSAVKIVFEDYIWPMFAEIADLTKVRTRPDAAQSPGVNP